MDVTKHRAPAICKAFNPDSDRDRENTPIIPQRVPAQIIKNGATLALLFSFNPSIFPQPLSKLHLLDI